MERAGSKRKRAGTSFSSSQPPSRLPSEAINPLSHAPSTLSQFLVAGLADSHEVPSRLVLDFPHRPWRDPGTQRKPRRRTRSVSSFASDAETDGETSGYATTTDGETEAETDAEGSVASLPRSKSYAAERAALRPLARSIAVFLSRDDVAAAKRAFAILMRSKISGKKVDIRRNHYWELGAEILMREQPLEETRTAFGSEEEDKKDALKPHQRPLYPMANIPRVRKYFEDLILQFPHHLTARKAVSALQFHPALLSYEIYQIHAQFLHSMKQLEVESQTWEAEPGSDNFDSRSSELDMEDGEDDSLMRTRQFDALFTGRETRLQQATDEIRGRTLESLRTVAEQINKLLDDSVYALSGEILRLGGVVSLFISDLVVPTYLPRPGDREEAEKRREVERGNARGYFEKALQRGAHVEAPIKEVLDMEMEEDVSEDPVMMPTFSSLPIRDLRG